MTVTARLDAGDEDEEVNWTKTEDIQLLLYLFTRIQFNMLTSPDINMI